MQLVTCAFPGTGKSTISKNAEQYGLKHCHVHFNDHTREYELTIPAGPGVPVFDSDSSVFDKNEFPGNYIKHIKEVLATCPDVVIFVSSHDNVRAALKEAGIEYQLAYPERELKGDYIERYKQRGSTEFFINLMDTKWNDFIDSCESDDGAKRHIILSEGEFLVDQLKDVLDQPLDIVPTDVVVEEKTTLVDPVFPTAIISGTESIGDIVCDDVGRPVAAWGHNGLEPLPAQSTDTSVAVEPITGEVIVPEGEAPAVVDTVVEAGDVSVTPDFSTAIVTGNESLGETVFNDIGTPIAIVGEDGLEPIPAPAIAEVTPAPLKDVFEGEPTPLDTPPPGVEVISAEVIAEVGTAPVDIVVPEDSPGTEPSVLNLPEEMQAPTNIEVPQLDIVADNEPPQVALDPESGNVAVSTDTGVTVDVDPGAGTVEVKQGEDTVLVDTAVTVAGQEDAGPEDNPTDLPVPADNIPPALQEMDKAELIENYHELNDDITVLEGVVEVCQTEQRDGLEGYEDNGVVFQKAAEHLKERYGADVEPTLAGMESFLEELKKVGTAVKRAFSDPKASAAKIKDGMYQMRKAADQYRSPAWQNKQDWINVGKVRVDVPGFLKEANSPEEVGSALKLAIKRVVDASEKHSKNDIARHKAAIKVFNATKGWDPEEKTAADAKELLDSIPDPLPGPVSDAGLDELNTSMVSVELPAIPKSNVGKVVDLMDMLAQASTDMFKFEDSIPEALGWEQYEKNKFLTKTNASKVYNIISSEGDEPGCSVISSAYYKQFLNVAKFLEMWILRSTK